MRWRLWSFCWLVCLSGIGGRIVGYVSWLDTKITEDWVTKWNYDPVSYFGHNDAESLDPTNEQLTVNLKGNELAVSPPFSLHVTLDHAFLLKQHKTTIVPWVHGPLGGVLLI